MGAKKQRPLVNFNRALILGNRSTVAALTGAVEETDKSQVLVQKGAPTMTKYVLLVAAILLAVCSLTNDNLSYQPG